ncbi:hypothetical protein BGZ60DRAFT_428119 [Tricladium varicosporioides]|nr:hypothetical protein BGZ60DRAFT_428119 [Hymenoscyphus varicosporioides]
MYKWHVHSALGRSRPIVSDLSKVADGIASSLRQFSISAGRCAKDGDAPQPSRSERSKEALNIIREFAPRPPPSRGIDARSLAAAPPRFTITRTESRDPGPERGPARFERSSLRLPGSRTGGGGGRGVTRGGGRGGRGRGGRRGGPRDKKKKRDDEEELEEPYNEEEKAWFKGNDCGWDTPYNPTTSAETLAQMGPPVISSARGIAETIAYKMQVATGNTAGAGRHAGHHLSKMYRGNGVAFFESKEQKEVAAEFKRKRDMEGYGTAMEFLGGKKPMGKLDQKEREMLTKAWVAGQYTAPGTPVGGDVLAQVGSFLRRNETYLPEDARKLEAKIASLLPNTAKNTRPSPRGARVNAQA